jgi:hypothetical protein
MSFAGYSKEWISIFESAGTYWVLSPRLVITPETISQIAAHLRHFLLDYTIDSLRSSFSVIT